MECGSRHWPLGALCARKQWDAPSSTICLRAHPIRQPHGRYATICVVGRPCAPICTHTRAAQISLQLHYLLRYLAENSDETLHPCPVALPTSWWLAAQIQRWPLPHPRLPAPSEWALAGVPKETAAEERRVALTPQGAANLIKAGLSVKVETDAGALAQFSVRPAHQVSRPAQSPTPRGPLAGHS